MSTIRVGRAELTATPTSVSTVRISRAEVTSSGSSSRVRIARAEVTTSTALVANAGPGQSVKALDAVILDGSASTGAGIDQWEWTVASGPAVTITNADQMYASFTAPAAWGAAVNVVVKLRVHDGTGWSAPAFTTIASARHRLFLVTAGGLSPIRYDRIAPPVVNLQPVAVIGSDQVITLGATVTIGGADFDPDAGDVVISTAFRQVSGPTTVALSGTGGTRTLTPTIAGTYVFEKTATDGHGAVSNPVRMTLTVNPAYGFQIGVVEPTLTSVGCRIPESQLQVINGNVTVTAGTPLVGKLVRGQVRWDTPNAVVRDCIIEGGAAPVFGTTWPLLRALTTGATDALVEWVTLRPSAPSVDIYGIQGGDFTMRYSIIAGVVDGCSINGSATVVKAVTIEACYIHDLRTYSPDPRQSDGITHNDGVQAAGNLDLTLRGNAIHGGRTSCILVQQGQGTYVKAYVDSNWLYGAPTTGSTFNVSENGRGPINNLTLTGNRVDRAGHAPRVLLPAATLAAATTTIAGNVFMDDGSPVPISPGA